ncbi:MAG: hypothetical protein RL094_797 [Candidatus Parcubacteria bacterium]|jgi:hypothetical protein
MLRQSLVGFVLKLGLASSLLYLALFSFFRPLEAISYYPSFLATSLDDRGVVYFIGIICILLIGWVFSNKQKFASSIVVTFFTVIIGIINITNISFLFRIAPTLAIGMALVFRYYPRVRVISKVPVPGTNKNINMQYILRTDELDIADDETDTANPVDNSLEQSDTK